MFQNYIKIAWRNLIKHKLYSLIKVGGFALSIAACLLIAFYIKDELSYDRTWSNADRIFRISIHGVMDGREVSSAAWPAPMAKAVKDDYPEVENSGRLLTQPLFENVGSNQLKKQGDVLNNYEEGFVYIDQSMLDMLEIPMINGDRSTALNEPNTMILSQSKAQKYFPGQNPVGKIMILNNNEARPFKIGGVMADLPYNSHIKFDFALSLTGHELWKGEQTSWGASNYYTYAMIRKETSASGFQDKLESIKTKYYLPMMEKEGDKVGLEIIKTAKIRIQPIPDIHLFSTNVEDRLEKSDIKFVWLFSVIALFILIIAGINFVNLSTAKSANRAKEVGLRKVIGSYRDTLVYQFLTESVLFSFMSFVIGTLLAILFLPYFNQLSDKHITLSWTDGWILPVTWIAAVLIGLIAGIYPAWYLSSFEPIQVLKGHVSKGSKNSFLRGGLVIFQFATSIFLIIGTVVIHNQTNYILSRNAGFDKDQIMLIQGTNTMNEKIKSFKNELLTSANIKSVTVSDYLPISGTKRDGNTFNIVGNKQNTVSAQKWEVDHDYIKTLNISLFQGRDFNKEIRGDTTAVIINRSMMTKLGLTNPIGKTITNGWQTFNIIGVIEDFNYESIREQINPLCLILNRDDAGIVSVKINGRDPAAMIERVSKIWKAYVRDQPIRFSFLDQKFATMYDDVKRTGQIVTCFSLLAIVIACLGLYALSAFMAEQRTKEIGIRKVLGASVKGITSMLSKEFILLISISIAIAAPLSAWVMNRWLQDFAYRIHIKWWMIAVSAMGTVLIALFTISYQSIKAAIANPIKSLRSE